MALRGTLDTFELADVLHLLETSSRTGRLQLEGDGGKGTVWVRDGRVTAAETDRVSGAPLDEVVCDLLRYETGSFTFELDEAAPQLAAPPSAHELLDRAEAMLTEWRALQTVVPSLEHRVGLVDAIPHEEITITASQWPALVAVGDGCTVGGLATTLGLTELHVLRTVHDLVVSGLTTIDDDRPARSRTRRPRTRYS